LLVYVIRRLLYSIPVLIAASFIIFSFVSISGDPLAGLRLGRDVNQEALDRIEERHHLNEPVLVQYWYWAQGAVTDGFGEDISGARIWPDLKTAMGNTMQLLILAEILAVLLAVGSGVYSAVRQYSPFDYAATTFSFVGFSTPVFWLALILQVLVTNLFLSTGYRLFYTAGLNSSGTDCLLCIDRIQHLALPVIVLSVAGIASYSRYMRASMLEVVNSDYVRTARAKGVRERRVVLHHALRNALIPVVTVVALDFGALLGGAVVTETIFSLNGMGLYLVTALNQRDLYPIMAWLMITATVIITFNLIADILYGFLDPRIRYE
jgi:peptide/nickel transport system permease protein